MSSGMILTTNGRNLLAKALTGKELAFTRAQVGNGSLGNKSASALTALISPKKDLPIQSISLSDSVGTCEVVLEMNNTGLTSGFFVREYGLFAKDPDTQKEVLYAYCNKGDEAGYLEGDNGVDIVAYTLSLVTVIDQATNVTAYITNSNQYVTVSRLEQRVADIYADSSTPAGFWSYSPNEDKRIRPITLNDTRDLILQGVDVAGLNSRLERAEDALNQILLQLELINDFPGASHYMAEDFRNTSTLDMFAAEITSIMAGDDSIDCVPIEGMLPGSIYTLSDGVKSERVQVHSINLENGIQRVILTEPVKNTYILASTVLYRTSATINEEMAIGPNARISQVWDNGFVWKGTGELETFTVDLDMSVNNSKSYTMTGTTMTNVGSAGLG